MKIHFEFLFYFILFYSRSTLKFWVCLTVQQLYFFLDYIDSVNLYQIQTKSMVLDYFN